MEAQIKTKQNKKICKVKVDTEIIKVGVVTIDVQSIGIKFENFMQAGCRD